MDHIPYASLYAQLQATYSSAFQQTEYFSAAIQNSIPSDMFAEYSRIQECYSSIFQSESYSQIAAQISQAYQAYENLSPAITNMDDVQEIRNIALEVMQSINLPLVPLQDIDLQLFGREDAVSQKEISSSTTGKLKLDKFVRATAKAFWDQIPKNITPELTAKLLWRFIVWLFFSVLLPSWFSSYISGQPRNTQVVIELINIALQPPSVPDFHQEAAESPSLDACATPPNAQDASR